MFRPSATRRSTATRALRRLALSSLVLGALIAADAREALAQSTPPAPKSTDGKGGKDKGAKDKDAKDKDAKPDPAAPAEPSAAEAPKAEPEEKRDPEKEDAHAITMSFDLGFTRPDLGGFSNGLDFDKTAANGLTYSLAAGLRMRNMRFGARWRVFDTTEFDLWSVMLEAGYTLPLRPVSPGFVAHLGYVWDQKLQRPVYAGSIPPRTTVLDPDVDLRGMIVGGEVQAMYWLTKFLRAGAYLGFDLLFLGRPTAGLPGTTFPLTDEYRSKPLYNEAGSGLGYALSIGVRGAFDVGF